MLLQPNLYHQGDSNCPMGLRYGQYRNNIDNKVAHNASWYNHDLDFIGYGDLSKDDLIRIAEELPPGEKFVVVPERFGITGCRQRGLLAAIAASVRFIIVSKQIYFVNHLTGRVDLGINYDVCKIDPEDAVKMLVTRRWWGKLVPRGMQTCD